MLNPDICLKCSKEQFKCIRGRENSIKAHKRKMIEDHAILCHINNPCPDKCNGQDCVTPAGNSEIVSIIANIPKECPYELEHTLTMKQPTVDDIIENYKNA